MAEINIRPIAVMRSDFNTKFGIPRQSGFTEGRIRGLRDLTAETARNISY